MNTNKTTEEKSYQAHIKHIGATKEKEEFLVLKHKESAHYKLAIISLDILKPFFKTSSTWLTVGDMTGIDANYLQDHGQDATASDLTDDLLKKSKENGFIQKFIRENAEQMSSKNDSFDYVMVKEAFHHFPRAYLSLYEMTRVCKKSVIILEPVDMLFKSPVLMALKNLMDTQGPTKINRFWKNRFSFETVGNYVFKLSAREVEKMAMGIGLPCIAFKGFNVLMLKDYSNLHKISMSSKTGKQYTRRLVIRNLLSRMGIIPYNRLCSVIFKEMPDEVLKTQLRKDGYQVIDLPKNPYID